MPLGVGEEGGRGVERGGVGSGGGRRGDPCGVYVPSIYSHAM